MFTYADPIGKKCVFCIHWDDPENNYIRPVYNMDNKWEYDFDAKRMCLRRKTYTPSIAFCPDFKCKI